MKALKFVGVLIIFFVIGWTSVYAQSNKRNCEDHSFTREHSGCLVGTFNHVGTFCTIEWSNMINNGFKYKYKFRQKDVLTNAESGEQYYFSAVGNRTYIWHWWKPQTDVMTVNWTWSLEDSNGNTIFNRHGTLNHTVNANGEIIVDKSMIKDMVCGGN